MVIQQKRDIIEYLLLLFYYADNMRVKTEGNNHILLENLIICG